MAVLAAAAGARADALEVGRALARKHCAFCHVVGDYNKFGGIDSTPSFQLLAGMKDGEARFQTFFARPPHLSFVSLPDRKPPTALPLNAPAVKLSYEEVKAIAAFALTLKDPRLAK